MRHPSQSSGLRFPSDLDLCLPCPPVNLSTCQLVLPSGQLANRSTDQLIAPSSVIHSALPHFGWQVAAPGGRWRRFSIQPSTQSSTQPSIQSSVIDSPLPRFRWQVAAPGGRWRVFRHLSSIQPSVICHRPSHPFRVAGGSPRWRVAALFHSALHSVLNAALHSVLRDRFSHLSSVIDSVIHSVIHSALPRQTRAARGAAPTSSQCPEITKNDEPRTRNSPDQHPL